MFQKIKDMIALRKAKKMADSTLKDMGYLVDIPMKRFKQYIKHKKLNAGQTKMLISEFETLYANFVDRKDALVKQAQTLKAGSKKRKECEDLINRMYLVLKRLEDRIVWLKERYNHIVKEV